MKRLLGLLLMVGILGVPLFALAAPSAANSGADAPKLDNRLDAASSTLENIMHVPVKGIPYSIAQHARCVIVVPGLFKGAFIFGAEYGQGVATCRTDHGWSGPVFVRMAGGSWGFQIGGKGTELVMVVTDKRGLDDLLSDKFTIGAGASAAVGPVGRTANASTDITMRADILSWSRSKGLFAGVDLKGVSVSQNVADTAEFYGSVHPFRQILAGDVRSPASADEFLHTVERYFGAARRYEDNH
ncbi:MAG TPA: lipid-binding SYLF domain-containing protein [Terracidiphilus sp.]|nr:lipid-binding SYLF domain-containing protein [Terracidiphilus sp.]